MNESIPTVTTELDRYLRTGETDPHYAAWPGGFLERAKQATADLRGARDVGRLLDLREH